MRLFILLLLLPLYLSSGQLQFERNSYLFSEGTSPVYDVTLSIFKLNSLDPVHTEKLKRNKLGELINLDNGIYKVFVSYKSRIVYKGYRSNEYKLNINNGLTKLKIGKFTKSINNNDLESVSSSIGYGIISLQKSDSIASIENAPENNQSSDLISEDVSEIKIDPLPEIQTKEISSNISDKKENKLQKKENVFIIKLIDDYKLEKVDFESALNKLEKLKTEGKISEDEFLITKDKIIDIYLYD
tara:strand:+ start:158 stop:886 length:729 start_codon:yes stop_codon:yes gene_type:complete